MRKDQPTTSFDILNVNTVVENNVQEITYHNNNQDWR